MGSRDNKKTCHPSDALEKNPVAAHVLLVVIVWNGLGHFDPDSPDNRPNARDGIAFPWAEKCPLGRVPVPTTAEAIETERPN